MYPCHGFRRSGCPYKPISDISAAQQPRCTHETRVLSSSVNTPLTCPWAQVLQARNGEKVNKQSGPRFCSSKPELTLPLMLHTKFPRSCFPNPRTSDCDIWPVPAIDQIFPFLWCLRHSFLEPQTPWTQRATAERHWHAPRVQNQNTTAAAETQLLSPANFHRFMLDGCCVVLFWFWWSPFRSWSGQDVDRQILGASERDYHRLLRYERLQKTGRQGRGKELKRYTAH